MRKTDFGLPCLHILFAKEARRQPAIFIDEQNYLMFRGGGGRPDALFPEQDKILLSQIDRKKNVSARCCRNLQGNCFVDLI
jgi:hypothetical protein